jgi:ATP-dependent helicase/DNAse subunit B
MALHLVHGPPNSGRAALIRERFTAALGAEPVLVVPTVDDVFSFERELCAGRPALLGGSILVFRGLFGEVVKAAGEPVPRPLTDAQRIRVLRAAIEGAQLGPLRRSASRPGFAAALDRLIDDLQASGLDPESVAAGASTLEGSAYLADLVALYRAYAELRDSRGAADSHTIARAATTALRRSPDRWRRRPVLLYGFDDLTVEQRELVGALAQATEVTVSLTYEDRAALAPRARLLGQLRELGSRSETEVEADPKHTHSGLLYHLQRNFLREDASRLKPDRSLTLLRAAGDRGEAELIGAEIARLLADGARAEEIAVAVRDPEGRGSLFALVLRSYGIPVALEADLPVAGTATGGSLLALLRAEFGSRTAADLLAYLRGPRRAAPGRVDRLERTIRRRRMGGAAEAEAAWAQQTGEPLHELARLREQSREPALLLAEVAALARDIAQWSLATDATRGMVPERNAALELRAAEAIAGAAEELAALEGLEPGPAELIATLEALRMPSWTGPTEGRVRIASPYRLRASRFRAVFVASLQDGEFPRHGTAGPFLSDEQRAALGLPERAETEAEERYLFAVCLALPTERLFLSYRTSDESGGAEARSPFIADVRRLLDPPAPDEPDETDEAEEALTSARGLGDVLFEATDAPSELELARSLAGRANGAPDARLAALGINGAAAARIGERLAAAAEVEEATRAPGPLRVQAVLDALGGVAAYGGTTLERFDECSYRWFVDHELNPQALDPEPEPLSQGGLMHKALEKLYLEAPGDDSLPRPGDLDRWISRGREIVDEVANARLSGHPADRAMRRRVERLLVAYLRREAAREDPQLRPALLEAGFRDDPEAPKGALPIGDWKLHGSIDRIDVGNGVGLVYDYKLAREVTSVAKFVEKGTLQLPLYLLALRQLWEIEPVGGLYQPLRGTKNHRPRGLVDAEEGGNLLADLGLYKNDLLAPDEFERALEEATARATTVVSRMRAGDIGRDPGPPPPYREHNQCPRYCTFAPICRRERAPFVELEPGEEEEEAG